MASIISRIYSKMLNLFFVYPSDKTINEKIDYYESITPPGGVRQRCQLNFPGREFCRNDVREQVCRLAGQDLGADSDSSAGRC